MRTVLLILILSFLLFTHVAGADPDKVYWGDVGQFQIGVNNSFSLDDYTITLTGTNQLDTGKYTAFLEIKNETTEDMETVNEGDTLFLSNNTTQFTYIRTDYANRQVFAAWHIRVPNLVLTSVITPIANTSNSKAEFTLKNDGAGEADNIIVDFKMPIGTDIFSTKTLFKDVALGSSATVSNSTTIFYSSALVNRTIVAHVTYTYGQGMQSGSFSKLLYMPTNDSAITTTVNNVDTSLAVAPTPTAPSTTVSPTTTTTTPTTSPTTSTTPSTTTTAKPATTNTTKKPRVVAFRAHPAPVVVPTPVVAPAASQQETQQPLTMPDLNFTLTKNDKGILLIGTLLFGWFIIYKI